MATSNNNHLLDTKQLWQQVEPFLTASSALSALASSEDGSGRFIYYINGSSFVRYDAYGNAPQKLASPLLTPTVFASLRYSKFSGTWGRVVSATTNTFRTAGLNANLLNGYKVRIVSGTGAGQVRTITACPAPIKYDQGVATVASASSIGDSTKKWKFNQWAGYQVRLTYSTGQTQIRKILYNDATTVYVADTNYQPLEPFSNAGFAITPITTAGSQTHFVIEASDLTVDTNWTVVPDSTSRYKIESGGCWLMTSNASAPFLSLQYYDEIMDTWFNKTIPASLFSAAFGTDGTHERTGEIGGVYASGTATAGSVYGLTNTGATGMTIDQFVNYRLRITGGTGAGQSRRILANSTTSFEVTKKWQITPDTTSTYEVIADKDKYYIGGNGQSFLMQHDLDSDLVIQGAKNDDGITCALACSYAGVDPSVIAITSGTRATGGISTVAISTAGTGYVVGEIITLATGTNGKVQVTSVSAGGVVTGISVLRMGSGYTVTTFAQSATTGVGTGFVASVTAIATVCNVVTAINHNFKIGDQVVLYGDANYAGTVTITGCDSLTGFDFVTAQASNMTASASQSATLIVDATKNWTVNEHVGKVVQTHVVGVAGAVLPRVITANTATTLTVATITTAMVNGTGRYIITDQSMFGRDEQFKVPSMGNTGRATGGSTTTLIDSTKNWTVNQWAGARLRIQAGTGRDAYITVTSNTATTLTYATQTFTPDTTTKYILQDSFGTCTGAGTTTTIIDSTKNWAVNQWAGKRVRITAGTGLGNEVAITSNTSNTLTVGTMSVATDATTVYTILAIPARGAGIELTWAFGGVSNGKYIFYPRGGASNGIDRYDVTKEVFEYSMFLSPQTDTMTAGTYYAYDGKDRIYFSPAVSSGQVQYVYYFDLTTGKVTALGAVPNTQGANVIGNRMEILTSTSGLSYLYHMRNSNVEMYRTLIWF